MNFERLFKDLNQFSHQLQNYFQSLEARFAWLVRTPLMVEIFIFAMLFFVFLLYVMGEKRKHLLIFLLILACPPTVFIPGLGKLVRESVWLSLKDNADQSNLWGWLYRLTPEGKGWSRKQVVYTSVLFAILAILCAQVVKLAREVEVDGENGVSTQVAEVPEAYVPTIPPTITNYPSATISNDLISAGSTSTREVVNSYNSELQLWRQSSQRCEVKGSSNGYTGSSQNLTLSPNNVFYMFGAVGSTVKYSGDVVSAINVNSPNDGAWLINDTNYVVEILVDDSLIRIWCIGEYLPNDERYTSLWTTDQTLDFMSAIVQQSTLEAENFDLTELNWITVFSWWLAQSNVSCVDHDSYYGESQLRILLPSGYVLLTEDPLGIPSITTSLVNVGKSEYINPLLAANNGTHARWFVNGWNREGKTGDIQMVIQPERLGFRYCYGPWIDELDLIINQ